MNHLVCFHSLQQRPVRRTSDLLSHLQNFYHTVICLQQVYIAKVTRTGKRNETCDVPWSAAAHPGLGNDTQTIWGGRLWIDLRLALLQARLTSGRGFLFSNLLGCSLTNTRSIYGRPGCHGNWGIVCKTQRGKERPSYTQLLIALYLKGNANGSEREDLDSWIFPQSCDGSVFLYMKHESVCNINNCFQSLDPLTKLFFYRWEI